MAATSIVPVTQGADAAEAYRSSPGRGADRATFTSAFAGLRRGGLCRGGRDRCRGGRSCGGRKR